jgi:hypothetical protein
MLQHVVTPLARCGALCATLAAQSYYIPSNTPTTGTCNVIPFGDTGSAPWSNQLYQTIATAADLGNTPGLITGIGFAPCGTGIHRNTRLRITLSMVPASTMLATTFASNLLSPVVVLDTTDFVWNVTAHQWNDIGLQVPFSYDGVSDLVMEVLAEGNTNTASGVDQGMHRDIRPRLYAVGWSGTPPAFGTAGNAALKWSVTMCVATVGLFGEGCGGLTHSYTGVPQLGAATLDARLTGCAPNSPAYLVLGSNNAAPLPIDLSFLGFTGCRLYQDIIVVIATSADASGNATVPFGPVPNRRSLSCLMLYTQGANLNLLAPGGLTTSNYARLLFGS